MAKNNIWQLQDAKSKFSEVVERALAQGAQIVTRRGRKTVVVMPFDEYERLSKPGQRLSQFLRESPLSGADLDVARSKDLPRQSEIE